jgi:hypothetical protein
VRHAHYVGELVVSILRHFALVDNDGVVQVAAFDKSALATGLKTQNWASLTDETFQRHVEEFLDPDVKEIEYVVVTRLVKINDFLSWVRENKKLPIHKEEHGGFFSTLKQIANGTTKTFTPFSQEETTALATGLKTKNWASLTDKIFQKKIKEFLNTEIGEIDYNAAPKVELKEAPKAAPMEPRQHPKRHRHVMPQHHLLQLNPLLKTETPKERKNLLLSKALRQVQEKQEHFTPKLKNTSKVLMLNGGKRNRMSFGVQQQQCPKPHPRPQHQQCPKPHQQQQRLKPHPRLPPQLTLSSTMTIHSLPKKNSHHSSKKNSGLSTKKRILGF